MCPISNQMGFGGVGESLYRWTWKVIREWARTAWSVLVNSKGGVGLWGKENECSR